MPSLGGPPMVLNKVYEVVTIGSIPTKVVDNRVHFLCTNAVAGDGIQDLLAAFQTRWFNRVLPHLWFGYKVSKWTGKELASTVSLPGPPVTYRPTYGAGDERIGQAGDVGQLATDPLPVETTVSVRLFTSQTGKSFRGAKHFSPVVEADTLPGGTNALTVASLGAWQLDMASFWLPMAMFAGSTVSMVVWSAKRAFLLNPANPSVGASLVTSASVNPNVGTQLSRHIRNP